MYNSLLQGTLYMLLIETNLLHVTFIKISLSNSTFPQLGRREENENDGHIWVERLAQRPKIYGRTFEYVTEQF